MPTEEKYRISLTFPLEVRDTLSRVKTMTGAASITEVIKRSLAVYKAIAESQAAGERIEVITQTGARRQLVVL